VAGFSATARPAPAPVPANEPNQRCAMSVGMITGAVLVAWMTTSTSGAATKLPLPAWLARTVTKPGPVNDRFVPAMVATLLGSLTSL
jgi:hypothetical protein